MTIIVFPGQGSQYANMCRDFYNDLSEVREIFDIVTESSKVDIKDIIFNNPDDLLNQTQYTQLSIFCCSISIFNVFFRNIDLDKFNFSCMLGHSLGEYTALTAAGYLSIQECSILLKTRGELMQNAYEPNKSGMVAIIGLDCLSAQKIIDENSLKIEVANDNSAMQIVISGSINDLEKAEKIFIQNGAKKYIFLKVSAAFHSNLMSVAEKKMKSYIFSANFNKSSIPIISNFNAELSDDIGVLSTNLSKQMSNKVRWVDSIKLLEKKNDTNVIEIGPGRVLSGLIKRISKNFNIENVEKLSDIDRLNK